MIDKFIQAFLDAEPDERTRLSQFVKNHIRPGREPYPAKTLCELCFFRDKYLHDALIGALEMRKYRLVDGSFKVIVLGSE